MNEQRVYELAHHHIRGFFYALTYDPASRLGGFWSGGFYPLIVSLRMDWGNPVQQWFMTTVSEWLPRFIGPFANGHFGIAIRRHPNAEVWSWALEWNRNVRVVGFFGHDETILQLTKDVPEPEMDTIGHYPDGGVLRMRLDVPLDDNGDMLFHIPE
jgi:hypothetical protein